MRPLTALAVAALLGSAFFGSRHYARRTPRLPSARFVTEDPAARAREGEESRRLGVALAGYEDLSRNDPNDLAALRGRIRTGLLIGAVAFGQPGLHELVKAQTDAYLARRDELDPDGRFLDGVAEQWVRERLHFTWLHIEGFYARTSTAIFLAARGDPAGRDMLLETARQGLPFYEQVFPYARLYHPGWLSMEPLVAHYLEGGDLAGRVEAGVTLLDYHGLFGAGGDLLERYLPDIHAAVKETRALLRGSAGEGLASLRGRAAIMGTAFLANRGDEDERCLLELAKSERELKYYAPYADTVRIARLCTGLADFAALSPLSEDFKDLEPEDQTLYYHAAAHRAAFLLRTGGGGAELARLLDLIEAAYDAGGPPATRVFSMQALLRLAPERGAALVERAIRGRGTLGIYAGALGDVADRVAHFLPALRSPEPDISALAAVSLLDRGTTYALQK